MITNILLIVCCILSLISIVTTVILIKKRGGNNANIVDYIDKQNQNTVNTIITNLKQTELGMQNQLNNISILQRNESALTQQKVDELTAKNEARIEKLTFDVNNNMRIIREENEKKLEQMRETVDEKLNTSLTTRLNDSFSK